MTAVADITSDVPARPFNLDTIREQLEQIAAIVDEASSDAELVDRMQMLVAIRNTADAALTTTEYSFARTHTERVVAAGQTEFERIERSLAGQIGLANQVSHTVGRTRLHTARDLYDGLTHIRRLHAAGRLSALRVTTITKACSHLDGDERAELDRRLIREDLLRLGLGQLRDLVTRLAAEIAPDKFRARAQNARTQRRVTIRQAPDGMADLTAHLPVEQAVACYAALHKAFNDAQVNPEPLTRTRGQVMADTLVERITGQTTAEDINVEVQVVVPLTALLDEDSPLPAEIPGYGPIPVEILARGSGRRMLRRLLTRKGVIVGGDSQSRCYPTGLAELIRARDRHRCTAPYCDAPARQSDHIIRAADGGPTTFHDGRATCELHNHLREQPGWWVAPDDDGGTITTTPTGHAYRSARVPRFAEPDGVQSTASDTHISVWRSSAADR